MSKLSTVKKANAAAGAATRREALGGKSAREGETERSGKVFVSHGVGASRKGKVAERDAFHAEFSLKRGVFGVIDDRVVVEKAREGVPFAEFERLAGLLELNAQEQAALLSITERTMARRVAEHGTLHALESERLVLLQKLAEYGVEVFEDAGKFNRWLRRPLPLLGGKSPLQYLDMSTGFVVVEQVLGRLAHGVYS